MSHENSFSALMSRFTFKSTMMAVLSLVVCLSGMSAEAAPKAAKRLRATSAQVTPVPVAEAPRVETPDQATEVRRGMHIEAFVEPQVRFTNKDNVFDRGFTLNDAALYLTKTFGTSEAVIDLPFAESFTGAAFAFDAARAQAYFNFDREKFYAKVGQFDTPFGIERNDSRDRFFMDAGMLKLLFLPKTHMGVQGGLSVEGGKLTLLAQVSNPNDQSRMGDENPEFALQGRVSAGNARGAIGLLVHEAKAVPTNKTNMIVDITGGANLDKLVLDAELSLRKFAGGDKQAFGLAGALAYLASPDLAVGARVEYLKDVQSPVLGGAPLQSLFSVAAGPSFKVEEGLLLRADFTLANSKADVPGATDETIFAIGGGLLASF